MTSRPKARLDYLILHREGRKVVKEGGKAEMDLDKIKFDEKLLVEDINHNLEVLKLNELNTENEIHEAVGIIKRIYVPDFGTFMLD